MAFIRVRWGPSGSKQGSEVVWLVFNKVILAVVLKQTLEGREESGRPVRRLWRSLGQEMTVA